MCIASSTRGGSVVCLLPYQFTWAPFKTVVDDHGHVFSCSKSDSHFGKVELILKSGERIKLNYAGCHNYVATVNGQIGRQHFRNEGIQWSSIKNQVDTIEMTENGKMTCLKF